MACKEASYIKGPFNHRRTEAAYMSELLDAVPLEAWREVVLAAVTAAKAGDASARAWLSQYLVGRPSTTAPAPLTVIVQQLSGVDTLAEELLKPALERMRFPDPLANEAAETALRTRVTAELRALEAQRCAEATAGENVLGTKPLPESSVS